MLPPTQHYLVSIRPQRKITLVKSFSISKWLKMYYYVYTSTNWRKNTMILYQWHEKNHFNKKNCIIGLLIAISNHKHKLKSYWFQEIDCFAKLGLRTLALGYKTITDDEFKNFEELLNGAAQSIVNRAKYEREVYQQMEKGKQQ